MIKTLGIISRRVLPLIIIAVFLIATPHASALSDDQKKAFQSQIYYFNLGVSGSCSSSPTGATFTPNGSQSSGVWNSGLQPPYYLEEFAIEVLKDVAVKANAPQGNAVTPQHVVALVGWMWEEGGGLTNNNSWNPLNTGINAPELLAGGHDAQGVQSFKSFDAGVEATARALMDPLQTRLPAVLTNASSTATDFVQALTYFQNYSGNHLWAAADDPNTPGAQQKYFDAVLTSIQQAARDYQNEASLILVASGNSARQNQHVQASQLKFGGTTIDSNGNTGNESACSPGAGGAVAGNVVQTAVNFSWPVSHGLTANPAYQAAIAQFNPGAPYGGADCGAFVATVMRASGADPNYPLSFTPNQAAYVIAHPEKYDVQYTVTSTADLQPGDILILNEGSFVDGSGVYHIGNGGGAAGHTLIYVGPQPNGTDEASASGGDRMPNLGKTVLNDPRGQYLRARLKQ